jgi:hypothetical protein
VGSKSIRRAAIAAAAIVSFASGPTLAQQAGGYFGFSADGEPIFIQVLPNPPFGFKLNEATVYYKITCATSGRTMHEALEFQLAQFINDGEAHFVATDHALFRIAARMTFHGKERVSGMIESRAPVFLTPGKHPKGAEFCISPKQRFEATVQTPEKLAELRARYGYAFGRGAK